jgi:hypothetical protein
MKQGGEWELVISDFLHEFNSFRTADFFEKEPGDWFSREMRAWLAGIAEYHISAIVSICQFQSGMKSLNISYLSRGRSHMMTLGSASLDAGTSATTHDI